MYSLGKGITWDKVTTWVSFYLGQFLDKVCMVQEGVGIQQPLYSHPNMPLPDPIHIYHSPPSFAT